jgi:colicin import membrane protein
MVVSATAHAAVLAWVIFGFVSEPPFAAATEPLPVEILTPAQFDHLTKGTLHGKELNSGKVAAKKIAAPTPEPKPDLPDAKENVTPPSPPPAPAHHEAEKKPPPKPKLAEAKPAPKPPLPKPAPPPKPVADDAAPVKKPPPAKKVDKQQMAELDKLIDHAAEKPAPKPQPKKVDRRDKADLAKLIDASDRPQAKPAHPTPEKHIEKFDPTKIAALIDRRDPGRVAPTAQAVSATGTAGIRDGVDGRLSVTQRRMIDGMVREQVEHCWNPPAGAVGADNLRVRVQFSLNADGSLSGAPAVTNTSSAPYFQVAAESAARAVRECSPLRLPAQFYSYWKDVEITFDPRDMMGG